MRIALAALCLAIAAPAAAQTAPASPLLGTWALDVSRMPIPAEARPRRVTISFGDVGGGKWRTEVIIVDAAGSETWQGGSYDLEGTPSTVVDGIEADITAAKLPAPDTLVVSLGKGGIPASTRIYTASADGQAMTETASYFAADGKPILRTNYFTRVR